MLCFFRNPLYTFTTSTIDITSTVTCVVNSVTTGTTPNPITTQPTTTGAPTTAYEILNNNNPTKLYIYNFYYLLAQPVRHFSGMNSSFLKY